jgi:hypothetical protein
MRDVSDSLRLQRSWKRSMSGVCKTVSGTIERIDGGKFGIGFPELAPQPLYVAVDGAVIDIDIVLIGNVHQLAARSHNAGPVASASKS